MNRKKALLSPVPFGLGCQTTGLIINCVDPRFIHMCVEFKVRRMGGSFGGKLKAAIALTCMAAIGATKHGRPVRIVCDMHTNMNCFGKRLPYYARYTVSVKKYIKNHSYKFEIESFIID